MLRASVSKKTDARSMCSKACASVSKVKLVKESCVPSVREYAKINESQNIL